MTGMRRRALGVLLIIAAPVAIAIGYANAPSATACSRINDLNQASARDRPAQPPRRPPTSQPPRYS
jgi:hypothetical protein